MTFQRIVDNRLADNIDLEKVYDEIRMRDAENHPLAYINYGKFRIEFKRASLRRNFIEADVRIYVKKQKDSGCSGPSR